MALNLAFLHVWYVHLVVGQFVFTCNGCVYDFYLDDLRLCRCVELGMVVAQLFCGRKCRHLDVYLLYVRNDI